MMTLSICLQHVELADSYWIKRILIDKTFLTFLDESHNDLQNQAWEL